MMMELRERELEINEEDERLLKTIKFPTNLKNLNENLPRPKYEKTNKTAKFISDIKEPAITSKKNIIPSLRSVMSEKNIGTLKAQTKCVMIGSTNGSALNLGARKPKVLTQDRKSVV